MAKGLRLFRYTGLLRSYAADQGVRLAAIAGLTAFSIAIGALQPWTMKILVDYGLKGDPIPPWLQTALSPLLAEPTARALVFAAGLASLALFALSTAATCGLNWLWTIVGWSMTSALSMDLFSRLQRRSLLVHYRSSVGDALSRLGTDAWCLVDLTHAIVISPFTQFLSLALVGTISWQMDRQLAMLALMMAPLLAMSSRFFGVRMKSRARQDREAHTRLVSFVQQTLAAIPVVQAFGRENINRLRFDTLARESTHSSRQSALVGSWYGMATGLITSIGGAIILYVGGHRVLAGTLSIGDLLVFLAYMNTLQSVSARVLNLYGTLKPLEARIDRVLDILDAVDHIPERSGAPALISSAGTPGRRVRLENVTFGYEPGHPVIEHVQITVEAGQTIALVGATGAGKTTVAGLIPRFYDPWDGRITIDGIDLRELQLASVRRNVAVVLQEPFILPISIAQNIAYGNPSASHHDIVAAAQAAQADRFIDRLPHGYDTIVGERGATLSGGEKQRLSIARALLKQAPILILDEPTSALDAETEASLVEALTRLMTGRTTFIIGHRLSTLRHAAEIVVFQHGRIVERGTHDALMRDGGVYCGYHDTQFPHPPVEVGA